LTNPVTMDRSLQWSTMVARPTSSEQFIFLGLVLELQTISIVVQQASLLYCASCMHTEIVHSILLGLIQPKFGCLSCSLAHHQAMS